jgi:hypothetical protein
VIRDSGLVTSNEVLLWVFEMVGEFKGVLPRPGVRREETVLLPDVSPSRWQSVRLEPPLSCTRMTWMQGRAQPSDDFLHTGLI